MPKFYFHIRDSVGLIRDTEGLELPSLRAAIVEAEASARSVAEQRKFMPTRCTIEVKDEEGVLVAVVPVFRAS